jgi:hypothetical protein
MMIKEEIANKIAADIEMICKKHKCDIGIWLSWRDMEATLEKMRKTPKFDEAHFGLQIRFRDD